MWNADNSVLLSWSEQSLVYLVDPFGNYLKLTHDDEPVWASPEADGVHLVTPTRHLFLENVPAPLLAIGSIGSTEPGSMLVAANAMFSEVGLA